MAERANKRWREFAVIRTDAKKAKTRIAVAAACVGALLEFVRALFMDCVLLVIW